MTKSLRESIAEAIRQSEELADAPYDGILGELPDWVPDGFSYRFREARRRVLAAGYNAEEAVRLLDAWEEVIGTDGAQSTPYVPVEITDEIELLWSIRSAIHLGDSDGLGVLMGRQDAASLRKGRKQTDHIQGLQPAAQRGKEKRRREKAGYYTPLIDWFFIEPTREGWELSNLSVAKLVIKKAKEDEGGPNLCYAKTTLANGLIASRRKEWMSFRKSVEGLYDNSRLGDGWLKTEEELVARLHIEQPFTEPRLSKEIIRTAFKAFRANFR